MEYGWSAYDTRTGGTQILHDTQLHVDLTTDFIQSSDGESWSLRVSGEPRTDPADQSGPPKIALIFHMAMEQMNSGSVSKSLACRNNQTSDQPKILAASCNGTNPTLGDFRLTMEGSGDGPVAGGLSVRSLLVTEEKIWQAKCSWRVLHPSSRLSC
jgi:mannosyl-oligosaccharide glucosidase